MRVLFLTGDIPFPANTGARLRTSNLLIELSKHVSITVAVIYKSDDFESRASTLERLGIKIIYASQVKPKQTGLYFGAVKNLFEKTPFIVAKHRNPQYESLVMECAGSSEFDLVHCDSISLVPAIMKVSSLPRMLTEHNMEALIWQRYAENQKNPFKSWYVKLQQRRVYSFERLACRMCDSVIAVSEEDRRHLQQQFGVTNVTVVPNGVDTKYFVPSTSILETNSLVFTGSMDWRPNQDAIRYFYDNIWPLIVHSKPDVKMYLVGRMPPSWMQSLAAEDSRVIVTGTVDDVRPYIARAAVYIVPLRIGGGSRLKILEAMAMKKPIVSTTVGAEGLGLENLKHILLADSPQAFASRVVALLDDPEQQNVLGNNGRALVESVYDWSNVAVRQLQAWRDTVAHYRNTGNIAVS